MEIIELNLHQINSLPEHTNLCLGYFDALHLGHQQLIKKAKKNASFLAVMTFDISPKSFINGNKNVTEIMSLFDKSVFLEKMDVDYLLYLHFDENIANMGKLDFIEIVLKKLNPQTIFVGEDYSFGKDGDGNASYLSKHFNVDIVPLLKIDNYKCSSALIRESISNGNISLANKLLGRPYSLSGLVVHGNGNGNKIGFPTANIDLIDRYVLPKIGVYSGYCYFMGKKKKAMISVSTHPTIQELNKPIIEVNILDTDVNLYGREIGVEFVEYIRDIVRFNSLEELVEQLKKDKAFIKNHLQ